MVVGKEKKRWKEEGVIKELETRLGNRLSAIKGEAATIYQETKKLLRSRV